MALTHHPVRDDRFRILPLETCSGTKSQHEVTRWGDVEPRPDRLILPTRPPRPLPLKLQQFGWCGHGEHATPNPRHWKAAAMSYDPNMEELRQTPRWWEAQFKKLLDANRPPYDPAEHEGHRVDVSYTLLSARGREYCIDCGWGET